MATSRRQSGFSLTETLMAVGTLAIGLLFVGGTFMTGIYFATVSTERTIASVVADEAFAKIQLYDADLNVAGLSTTGFVAYTQAAATVPATEFLYPSTPERSPGQYSWSALCRRENVNDHLVRSMVFVCRATGASSKYWVRDSGSALSQSNLPHPVRVTLMQSASLPANEAQIVDMIPTDTIDERAFINDGTSLVDDATGQIYRVLRRPADRPDVIVLDRDWTGGSLAQPGGIVWVVPPPVSGGRNPLIGIYQRTIRVSGAAVAPPRDT